MSWSCYEADNFNFIIDCVVMDKRFGPMSYGGDACDNTCAADGLDKDGNECEEVIPELPEVPEVIEDDAPVAATETATDATTEDATETATDAASTDAATEDATETATDATTEDATTEAEATETATDATTEDATEHAQVDRRSFP